MKVYIVEGSCGEYSDHRDWVICGYLDEAHAERHVLLASARYRDIRQAMGGEHSWNYDREKWPNEYDPHMDMDYTGTNYRYYAVEIREAAP